MKTPQDDRRRQADRRRITGAIFVSFFIVSSSLHAVVRFFKHIAWNAEAFDIMIKQLTCFTRSGNSLRIATCGFRIADLEEMITEELHDEMKDLLLHRSNHVLTLLRQFEKCGKEPVELKKEA